jgi:tetratricopeptide (TPR) repeat protein
LSLDPTDEKAWYNKALICYMMSQRSEAHKCVLRALSLSPGYEDAKKLRELLEGP